MVNKKLKNGGEGIASSDVITKHHIDAAMIDKHDNNQNIDLKNNTMSSTANSKHSMK